MPPAVTRAAAVAFGPRCSSSTAFLNRRARATARLSDLVRDSIAADESHGPILLCGGAVPPSAVSNGFACIRLDASIDDLRDSLEMATFTAGGAAAAELRDNGADLISSTRKLQRVLRCEDVRLMDAFHHHAPRGGSGSGASASGGGGGVLPLGTSEAMRMTKTLLLDGDGLRSALDVPWTGLFLDLLSSGRADSDAEDHGLEFIDAPCGGGSLRVYGEEGASEALSYVRSSWRSMRMVQERYMLAAELRERLDCRAVHAFGASCHSTAVSEEQCLSLRRLLRVLREQPVLLGAVEDDLLSSFTLTIGEAPEKGSPMARELAEAERTTANYLANYRSNIPRAPPLTLSLPDAFEANEVLELLEEASRQVRHQQPSQRKRGGGGGGRANRSRKRRSFCTSAAPPTAVGPIVVRESHALEPVAPGAALANGDLTGLRVWEAAPALVSHLTRHADRLVVGKTAIELGSGTGACGLAAAALGASRVVLTRARTATIVGEHGWQENDTLARLDASVALNHSLSSIVDVSELEWGNESHVRALGKTSRFDLVLASDCLYYPTHTYERLASTIRWLTPPGGAVVLAWKERHGGEGQFAEMLEEDAQFERVSLDTRRG